MATINFRDRTLTDLSRRITRPVDVPFDLESRRRGVSDTPRTTTPTTPTPTTPTTTPTTDFYGQVRTLFPYLPEPLVRVFADAWATTGSVELALQTMRQNRPVYDAYFPGNRRDDGTLRLSEFEYLSTVEGYKRRLAEFGVPPDIVLTTERQRQLIGGEKSPDEFGAELSALYVGVVTQGDNIRAYYARNYGALDLSDAALFASAIDRQGSAVEFERRIRSAQVGGEAARFGFDVRREEAERLASFGLEGEASRRLFGQASEQLPRLNELVRRFNDPADALTVEDYTDALVIEDPEQLRVIGRLLGRSRAQFSDDDLIERSQTGALTGLQLR